jgi:hypothetical protein
MLKFMDILFIQKFLVIYNMEFFFIFYFNIYRLLFVDNKIKKVK